MGDQSPTRHARSASGRRTSRLPSCFSASSSVTCQSASPVVPRTVGASPGAVGPAPAADVVGAFVHAEDSAKFLSPKQGTSVQSRCWVRRTMTSTSTHFLWRLKLSVIIFSNMMAPLIANFLCFSLATSQMSEATFCTGEN